ncbi:hypothetical protein ACFQ21_02630 [Ohtaekwangia kribbensis]|uniref:Uncharacterized protein n=1 Tax=Ohtaekwangia kribbensis TaxID=688913 RepID=A0ABW3JW28_9BACT
MAFNPSKESIKLASLNKLHDDAHAVLDSVKAAKTAFDNATNDRETSFAPLKKLSTKIVNALAATDASKLTLDDASSINFKIQGRRNGKKVVAVAGKDDTPPEPAGISVSQQSFDTLVDNFAKLTQTVAAEAHYTPNENELRVTTPNSLLADLRARNKAVVAAITSLSNARIARDTLLHAANTGLYDTAQSVKQYIKSLFDATSPQYRQVSGIKFTSRA